jgi:pimeloyl-ACP methyl ester carboxylesterase
MRPLLWFTAVLLCGCFRVPPTPTPMTFVADPLPGKAKCLLVLFPGARDRAEDFRSEHFIEDIRRSGLSVDVVAADATIGYYFQNIAAKRLEEDVIGPARAKGYDQVWLLGISMGGYGTFNYAQSYPEHVDGIAAFAPYLGEEAVVQSIRDAGGLAKWTPPEVVTEVTTDNHTPQLWGYLHRITTGKLPSPELYLGCGDTDRMKESVAVLAAAMPPERVLTTAGGHTWGPWRDLLKQFLARSVFRDRCQP